MSHNSTNPRLLGKLRSRREHSLWERLGLLRPITTLAQPDAGGKPKRAPKDKPDGQV